MTKEKDILSLIMEVVASETGMNVYNENKENETLEYINDRLTEETAYKILGPIYAATEELLIPPGAKKITHNTNEEMEQVFEGITSDKNDTEICNLLLGILLDKIRETKTPLEIYPGDEDKNYKFIKELLKVPTIQDKFYNLLEFELEELFSNKDLVSKVLKDM